MIRKEYTIFDNLDKGERLFQSVLMFSFEPRALDFYPRMAYHPEEAKTYLFTDKTMSRLSTMDFSALEPEEIMAVAQGSTTEKGFILSTGTYQKLHLGYLITPNQIVLPVFKGEVRSIDTLDGLMTKMVGTVIVNEGAVSYSPVNRLSAVQKLNEFGEQPLEAYMEYMKNFNRNEQAEVFKLMKRILRLDGVDTDGGGNDGRIIGTRLSLRHMVETPAIREDNIIGPLLSDFAAKYAQLQTAFRMFLFLKCADIRHKRIVDENKTVPKLSYNRKVRRMTYTVVDSTWDEEITVDNPFVVRGHFRLQPYKDGPKLIYIDSFWKKGYHRRSGKEINENPENPEESAE